MAVLHCMFIGATGVVIIKFVIIYKLYLILVSANWFAHLDSRQMAKGDTAQMFYRILQ